MKVGMLWFDNDPKSALNTKVERAALYYRDKYGRMPTVCFVHPSMIPEAEIKSRNGKVKDTKGGTLSVRSKSLDIRSNQSILPNHFWIGVNGIKSPDSSS